MTTIFMKIASESMDIEFSQVNKDNKVMATSFKSISYSRHSIELQEKEIRELRNFLTIQLRKLKQLQP